MSFEDYLKEQKLAESTIKIHLKNLDILGTKDSQEDYVTKIVEPNTASKQQSLAGTASKYLQYRNKPNDKIVSYIKELHQLLQEESQKRQKKIGEDTSLPTMKELKKRMNELYDNQDYKGFCIMYLMVTYQVRNMDMMATIVTNKKETNTTENFFVVGKSQVTWIRNKYKTSDKFGTKTNVIKNKKFIHAISELEELLKPTENIDRVIKKITGGITEAVIAKIFLRENNNMNAVKKVSKNRGTSAEVLLDSYNIT